MPSQEEVHRAINELGGFADFNDLKEYFGMEHLKGNSCLPQRIRALERDGKITRLRLGNKSIFISLDFSCSREEAIKILKEFGILKEQKKEQRKRGRPRGTYVYNDEMIYKIMDFIREKKVVTRWQIRKHLKINDKTVNKYLNKLLSDGAIFKINSGGWELYTIFNL